MITKHLTLKEHHMKTIQKNEANERLLEIEDANSFLEIHGANEDFDASLEDIPLLISEANYAWMDE